MNILAISGSLRASSSNTALLNFARSNTPAHIAVEIFSQIADIPAFNPDDETGPPPRAVAALRSAVLGADVVLFSTPEYAHGVPGSLKNALDWLVGSGEFYERPFAFLHASQRGAIARASLKETLVTMGAAFAGEAVVAADDAAMMRAELAKIATAAREARSEAQNVA